MTTLVTHPFDPAEFLTDDETIRHFLAAAVESEDLDHLREALAIAADARGRNSGTEGPMTRVGEGFEDVAAALHEFGLALTVKAA